ncbi:MAG: ABC transporter ATP-binding protein [Planctomycetaceae bacterium]
MPVLEARHLRKTFDGFVAVEDVNFAVEPGEVFGLLGPNGAGKSTTMMMLAGLLPPDGGTVLIDGEPFDSRDRALRKTLGVVPQDLAIYPELSARENLAFFGRLYGVRGALLQERIAEALERIGLTGRADDRVGHFSGGMKRRLNFGAALLHRPRVLILDEPTVGVDPQSRAHLLDCIRDASRDGTACLYASHYMEEVQAICQRVAIIDHGRMLACDTLRDLLGRLTTDLCLRIPAASDELRRRLNGTTEIESTPDGGTLLVVSRDQQQDEKALADTLAHVLDLLRETNTPLEAVETRDPDLERLFLQLTGQRLRD